MCVRCAVCGVRIGCVSVGCVSGCVLGSRLAVVFDPGDGSFAEETVLVVHQMLVDAGSAEGTQSSVYRMSICGCDAFVGTRTHLQDLCEQGLKMAEMEWA